MHWEDHEITEVRKVPYDQLWHICYRTGKRENYDRVTRAVALRVAKNIWDRNAKFFAQRNKILDKP